MNNKQDITMKFERKQIKWTQRFYWHLWTCDIIDQSEKAHGKNGEAEKVEVNILSSLSR